MIFGLPQFVILVGLFLATYEFVGRTRFNQAFLAVFSIIFYLIFAGFAATSILFFCSALTLTGLSLYSRSLRFLIICILVAVLFSFKYLENLLLVEKVDSWIQPAKLTIFLSYQDWIPNFLIPLGISFYIFELIHLLVERNRANMPRLSFVNYIGFVAFWPTVIAGPIKRIENFSIPKISDEKWFIRFRYSVLLVALGYLYKFIADNFQAFIRVYENNFLNLSTVDARILIFLLGMRIFLDFAGYSLIAIGIARYMGIVIPKNFDAPYIAINIRDFWRRWHISLSSWIRDYIYIPLGGNKVGRLRQQLNVIITMAICGAWHGNTLNYFFWGIWHGVLLIVYNIFNDFKRLYFPKKYLFKSRVYVNTMDSFSWLLTQTLVFVGWVLFFFPLDKALTLLGKAF